MLHAVACLTVVLGGGVHGACCVESHYSLGGGVHGAHCMESWCMLWSPTIVLQGGIVLHHAPHHDHVQIFSARHSALVNSASSGLGFRVSVIKS